MWNSWETHLGINKWSHTSSIMYGTDMASFTLQKRYTVIKHKHKTPDVTLKFNMELANDIKWWYPKGILFSSGWFSGFMLNLRGILVCMVPVLTLFLIKVPKGNSAKALCLSVQLMRPSSSCWKEAWCFWKKRVGHGQIVFCTSEILSFLKNNDNNQQQRNPSKRTTRQNKTKHTITKKTNKRQRQQTKTTTIATTTTTNQQTNQPVNH